MAAGKKKDTQGSAAEEDARNLLLAGGYDPNDREALAALLLPPPGVERKLLTPQEFREACNISESTYYRSRREGRGPELVTVMGSDRSVRIKVEEVPKWIARNTKPEKGQTQASDYEMLLMHGELSLPIPPPRRKHAASPAAVQAEQGKRKPSMYDPPKKPPRKLRRVK